MRRDKCSKSICRNGNQRAASGTRPPKQDTVPIAPYNQPIPYH